MLRPLLIVAAMALGLVTVAAQQNGAEERSALMGVQANRTYGVLNRMVRGQQPYDQARVDEAFVKLAETLERLPSLFPESSKGQVAAKSNYAAAPGAWDNKAERDAQIAKIAKVVADLRPRVRSLDDLKAAYPILNGGCNDCHQQYRLRKS